MESSISSTEEIRQTIQEARRRKAVLEAKLQEQKALIQNVNQGLGAFQRFADLVQATAAAVEAQAHAEVSAIVTDCFNAVYERDCVFELRFEKKRGRTEAVPVLIDEQGGEFSILDELGGGYVDVLSFGLRIACLILAKPACRRLLILDEPFKWVDKDRTANLIALITRLSDELGIQFIIITHIAEFKLGNVITIGEFANGEEDTRGSERADEE